MPDPWHGLCVQAVPTTGLAEMPTSPEIAAPDAHAAVPAVDLSRKFVRVLRQQPDGLVAFEFAIGWPDLAVELAMPRPMFDEFCRRQQVERLPDDAASPALGDAARDQDEGDDA
jgi:phenol hydroxylase P0 protein